MKLYGIIFSILLLSTSSIHLPSLEGKWIDEADYRNKVVFTKSTMYEIFDNDTNFFSKYIKLNTSCDSAYLNTSEKASFFKLDNGDCFEITGLSDSILAYRHSKTGKLHILHKVN
jgi:hypothetical protein